MGELAMRSKSPDPIEIDVTPLSRLMIHNNVETMILELAREDGEGTRLTSNDYLDGNEQFKFETRQHRQIVRWYVEERMKEDADPDLLAEQFNQRIRPFDFPPKYKPDIYADLSPNPNRVAPILREKMRFGYVFGWMLADGELQKKDLDWNVFRQGVWIENTWPFTGVPGIDRLPLVSGFTLMVTHGNDDGGMKREEDGKVLGTVETVSGEIYGEFGFDFYVTRWAALRAVGLMGFEFGRFDTDLTPLGEAVIEDPCHLEGVDNLIKDPDQVTEAVQCEVTTTVGLYYGFPKGASIGLRLWDRLNLDATYTHRGTNASSDLFLPDSMHNLMIRAGIDVF